MKVAVVGAGVVGLTCAFELSRAGADVVVFERGQPGHGTSLGNTGWVCPSFTYPLPGPGIVGEGLRATISRDGPLAIRPSLDPSYLRWLWAFRRNCTRARWLESMAAFVELNRPTTDLLESYRSAGVAFELHTAGLLLVALDQVKLTSYRSVFRDLKQLGFEGGLREVTGEEARSLEPVLSGRTAGGVLAEIDRWVEPLSLTGGLAAWLRGQGVKIHEGVEVTSARDGRVETPLGSHQVDAIVIATGIQSGPLLRRLGICVGIVPARGYSVTYRRDDSATPGRALYLADARVGVSAYDAAVRVAGVFELGWSDTTVRERRLAAMLRMIDPFFESWSASGTAREATWSGLRPLTSDGLPLIGRAPADPTVFIATGHGMLGVTLAPATAALLAPVVLGRPTAPALAPFDPARRP